MSKTIPQCLLILLLCTAGLTSAQSRQPRGKKQTTNLIGTTWKIFMIDGGVELGTYTFLSEGCVKQDQKARWALSGNKLNITEEYGDIDLIVNGNVMTGSGQLGMNPRPFRLRGVKVQEEGSSNETNSTKGRKGVPSGAPSVYVEQGACPFECCTYREWWAVEPTPVLSSPASGARQVKRLVKGERVRALTGFVRTQAAEFVVTRNNGRYHVGDTIWVYSYRGEGFFTIWFRGKMYSEELGFSPYGGTGGARCQDDPANCWGTLKTEHISEWWIKLRLRDGRIGWTNRAEDYDNKDRCS